MLISVTELSPVRAGRGVLKSSGSWSPKPTDRFWVFISKYLVIYFQFCFEHNGFIKLDSGLYFHEAEASVFMPAITATAQTAQTEPHFSTYIIFVGSDEIDRFMLKPTVEVMPLGQH